jgi:hypothetical protein
MGALKHFVYLKENAGRQTTTTLCTPTAILMDGT